MCRVYSVEEEVYEYVLQENLEDGSLLLGGSAWNDVCNGGRGEDGAERVCGKLLPRPEYLTRQR